MENKLWNGDIDSHKYAVDNLELPELTAADLMHRITKEMLLDNVAVDLSSKKLNVKITLPEDIDILRVSDARGGIQVVETSDMISTLQDLMLLCEMELVALSCGHPTNVRASVSRFNDQLHFMPLNDTSDKVEQTFLYKGSYAHMVIRNFQMFYSHKINTERMVFLLAHKTLKVAYRCALTLETTNTGSRCSTARFVMQEVTQQDHEKLTGGKNYFFEVKTAKTGADIDEHS